MRPCTHKLLRLGLLAALLLAGTGQAAAPLSELKLFKSAPMGQGLWRMELISSDDPQMARGAAAMGQTGLCMDVARQMSKNTPAEDPRCTPKVLRNTDSQAEIEVSCKDGGSSRMLMTRESEKSYLMDSTVSKDGKQRSFKVRYTHAGACKGESMMQFDKNSPMCKQMDPAKMLAGCARLPETSRAACEQQMKGLAASCQ
ncbi:DUF3617 family protein [Rhodoferax sp. BAB1]|uniref:DUF3617 family protein n=1 Tax=Rhodoferax sp. BAB1 TaxID=2741720 RepID=UPI0015768B00|nr:DUF3617 family protein [Rhodoferax sp. BAB1]QKO20523.1 hypothetical protein HTY51_00790 [Rhodoferax sp. BAB1]